MPLLSNATPFSSLVAPRRAATSVTGGWDRKKMSANAVILFVITAAMSVGPVARAQTADKSPPESKDADASQAAVAQGTAEKEVSPPPKPDEQKKPAAPILVNPWFVRPPFEIKSGEWKLQIYGFADIDVLNDSTRSFTDGVNNSVIAHDGTQAGTMGRTQMTARNSRIGVKVTAPEFAGIKSTGLVEGDFFGYDPNSSAGGTPVPTGAAAPPSEGGFMNNPTWRLRHAYLKLESDVLDILIGQTWHVLGWQSTYLAATAAFLGLPSEVFGRTQMVRLGRTFKSDFMNFEIAIAASRPVQRDSSIPDGEGGLRLLINKWKGIHTIGNGGTAAFPTAIAVSGMVRRFRVDQFKATPTVGTYNLDTGYAIAVDALIPIIHVADNTDRGNALTLLGEFSTGTGDADEFTSMTGGATNRLAPMATTGPNIDNGLVTYDASGYLHTIPWQTFLIGLEYYVPPTGRLFLSVNYTQGDSSAMQDLYPNARGVFKGAQYGDVSVFFDVTPAVRLEAGYQYTVQRFCDNTTARNQRYEFGGQYFF